MINLVLITFLIICLSGWTIFSFLTLPNLHLKYANSINRLEVEVMRSRVISKLIAVLIVALTYFTVLILALFVNKSYAEGLFKPIELPYNELISGTMVLLGLSILLSNWVCQKAFNQLSFQKSNLSFVLVQKLKTANTFSNFAILSFGLVWVLQITYKAFNI